MKIVSTKRRHHIVCSFSPQYSTVEEIREIGQTIIYYPIITSWGYILRSYFSKEFFAGHIKHNVYDPE